MDKFGAIFLLCFLILFFLVYFLNQNKINRNNRAISEKMRQYVLKDFKNLTGKIILYPFFDSELNQKISPEKYDFLFCSFGLIILPKHYKPIITFYNQTKDYIKDVKINKCNYIRHKINPNTKELDLQVSGIGSVIRIRILISPESKETGEEINELIDSMLVNSA
ncbi:MAG: hypothetical protein JST58_03985 [Bacteroidetes bacterium]|nr:hypothetical protein [Bacteroidota bacterium]